MVPRYHITSEEDGILIRSLWRLRSDHWPNAGLQFCKRNCHCVFGEIQLFVTTNSIKADKVVPTLLTVVGPSHYTLLRGLVAPKMPRDLSFDELEDTLKKHFDPEPIHTAEHFHFYQRNQNAGESIGDYLATLRRLPSTCKFGHFLDDVLHYRLICGILNEATQKVLLTKSDLTLSKAISVAQGMEAAALKSKELHAKCNQRSTSSVIWLSTRLQLLLLVLVLAVTVVMETTILVRVIIAP